MNIGLKLIPGTLPNPDCWPATPQSLYTQMFELGSAQTSELSGVIISETEPDPSDRDKQWDKVIGGVPQGSFLWNSVINQWVWPHLYAPSSPVRLMWAGDLAALPLFDGGDAGIAGVASGPMWEVDATVAGRVPVGPGNLNGSGTVVAQGGTGGTDQVTLGIANIPPHTHTVPLPQNTTADGSNGQYLINQNSGTQDTGSTGGSGTPPVVQPFTTMPPYIGIYVIKRTSQRVWYLG